MFGKKKAKAKRDPRLDDLLKVVRRLHPEAEIDDELECVRAPAMNSAVRFTIAEDLETFNGCANSLGVQKDWIYAKYVIAYLREVSRENLAEFVLQLTSNEEMYRVQASLEDGLGVIVITEWVPFSLDQRDIKIFLQRMLTVNLAANNICYFLAEEIDLPTPREIEYGEKYSLNGN